MKKTLLLAALFAAGFGANAQVVNPLPNGSIAPDFTASDVVNDVEYSLYEDYLDNEKSVIIDFSATWCGPCWNYHKTHALADIYEAYGPNGSDEVMVIFVEGDHVTTVEDIFGVASQPGATIGDWTVGSPYPIINDTPALNLSHTSKYSIGYFPTVYTICEGTKTTNLVNQQTATQLKASLGLCQELVGVPNHGMINAPEAVIRVCSSGEMANIQAKLKNFGNNNITAAVVELRKNGVMVATTDYAGNLAQFGTPANINFEDVVIETGAEYTIHLMNINGQAAFNQDLTEAAVTYEIADTAEYNNLEVLVYTDNYPGEITWQIKDASGAVVAEGGPYEEGPEEYGGGGDDANTVMTHSVNLPADGDQCYSVVLKDSFGDGWIYGGTPHGIEIYSNDEMVFQKMVGATNFGSQLQNPSAFRATGVLGNEEVTETTFSMYPNPSTGVINFITNEPVAVTVMDITGKVVFTAKEVNNGGSINLGSLQSGVYVAKINGASGERTEKLVIK